VPPLLKGYMRSGAWICGEPAWDPAFHCADLFLLMPLANLNDRYARRYIAEKP
jgi:putative hemolysin